MVALVVLKVFADIVVFDPLAAQAFDLPKAIVSQATACALAACLVFAILRYSTSIVPRTRLHFLIAAFLAVAALSSVTAEDHYLAVFGDRARYLGLVFLVDMAVLYLATAVAVRTRRDLLVIVAAVAAGLAVAATYAAIQRMGLDPVHWARDPQERPFATLGNPDMLGEFLAVAFAVMGAVALLGRDLPARLRVGALLLALVSVVAASVVATRSTLVGIAAALVALAIVYVHASSWRTLRSVPVLAGAALVALITVGVVLATPLGERARATLRGAEIDDRIMIWQVAMRATADRPILGWGPDNFAAAFPSYRPAEAALLLAPGELESSAHSWLLETASTTGMTGALALVLTIGAFVVACWRTLGRNLMLGAIVFVGSAAYWAQGLVSVGAVGIDWWPWLSFGLIAGATGVRPEPRQRPRAVSVGVAWGLAMVVVALALAGSGAWSATRSALAATRAIDTNHANLALTAARSAVSSDPGRAEHWNALGLANDLRRSWRESGDAYAEAAARAPYDATYWENLARSRAQQALAGDGSRGGPDAALAAADRAVKIDPNNQTAQQVYAEVANAFGRYPAAWEALLRAVTLSKTQPSSDQLARDAAMRDPDAKRAKQWLERIVLVKESPTILIALAEADLRDGDKAAARASLTRALQIEPGNPDATRLLATVGG